MENLIKALQIFLKYGNPEYPTHCEHDVLMICGYEWDHISEIDKKELETLGFFDSGDPEKGIISYRFGSC